MVYDEAREVMLNVCYDEVRLPTNTERILFAISDGDIVKSGEGAGDAAKGLRVARVNCLVVGVVPRIG
jgi:hypothetical protein